MSQSNPLLSQPSQLNQPSQKQKIYAPPPCAPANISRMNPPLPQRPIGLPAQQQKIPDAITAVNALKAKAAAARENRLMPQRYLEGILGN